MLFVDLAVASAAVAATGKRNDKVAAFVEVLTRLEPDEVVPAVAFLTGTTPVGRIGVGWSTLSDIDVDPAPTPTLSVSDVEAVVRAVKSMSGDGVLEARRVALRSVFGAAVAVEQRLLYGIFGGELRQGALDGVLTTAVATAADVPVTAVRRAAMMAGSLGPAAAAALGGGRSALDAVRMEPLRAVQPMLASPSPSAADAVAELGEAVVDWKLDGARIQAHRRGDEIRLFTRNLNDVTGRLPTIVDRVRGFGGGDIVLDGEVLGFVGDDEALDVASPRRFQDTMGDFGASAGGGRGGSLQAFFFDVMYADGEPIHDRPLRERLATLTEVVPAASRVPSLITDDPDVAQRFMDDVVAHGHEGVVVKSLDHPYEAGRRGTGWRKVKPVHTVDLVVLAVEWGHGRRTGLLSNLHLGALGTDGSSFVMVGKTFKGLTDELLRWQTERFLELQIPAADGRGNVVHVRPEQVVEVAIDGVQVSRRYPGGVALRFARVKRYRSDKSADQADPIDVLRALL